MTSLRDQLFPNSRSTKVLDEFERLLEAIFVNHHNYFEEKGIDVKQLVLTTISDSGVTYSVSKECDPAILSEIDLAFSKAKSAYEDSAS